MGGLDFMTNKKNIRYNIDDHHHGLFIKEARLRQSYRVVALTDGICSPAYLSKIEAGITIPAPDMFEKMAQRLKIQFPTGHCNGLVKTVRQFIYEERIDELQHYLTGDSLHDYEKQLGRFFQAVLLKDYEQAAQLKKLIDQFSHHLNAEEQQFYLLLNGISSFDNFEWERGKKYFKRALDLMFKLKIDDPYLYYQLAKYYFQTQNVSLGFAFLERATTEFKKLYAKDWVFRCGVLKCREYIKNNEIENAKAGLESLKRIVTSNQDKPEWSDIFNIQALIYEQLSECHEADFYFTKSLETTMGVTNDDYLLDAIKFYYNGQKNKKMLQLIERLDLNALSQRNRILADFYYFKATHVKQDDFELFLRKEALPYAIRTLNARDVNFYTKELTALCRGNLRHKRAAEAYYKWEKFRDGIEQNGVIQ